MPWPGLDLFDPCDSSSSHGKVRFTGKTEPVEAALAGLLKAKLAEPVAILLLLVEPEAMARDEEPADDAGRCLENSGASGTSTTGFDGCTGSDLRLTRGRAAVVERPVEAVAHPLVDDDDELTDPVLIPELLADRATALPLSTVGFGTACAALTLPGRAFGGVGGQSSELRVNSGRSFSSSESPHDRLGCDDSILSLPLMSFESTARVSEAVCASEQC